MARYSFYFDLTFIVFVAIQFSSVVLCPAVLLYLAPRAETAINLLPEQGRVHVTENPLHAVTLEMSGVGNRVEPQLSRTPSLQKSAVVRRPSAQSARHELTPPTRMESSLSGESLAAPSETSRVSDVSGLSRTGSARRAEVTHTRRESTRELISHSRVGLFSGETWTPPPTDVYPARLPPLPTPSPRPPDFGLRRESMPSRAYVPNRSESISGPAGLNRTGSRQGALARSYSSRPRYRDSRT